MISKVERAIAFRYLKPKKKEGFLKIISIFSFVGIALGVAILIIVMSVMFEEIHHNMHLGLVEHRVEGTDFDEIIYADDTICGFCDW